MKKTIIILVILGLSVSIYSQNMNTESVLEIYNQTFLDFFSNKAKHTESKEFFILSDSSHQNIKTDFEDFKIHFITEEESKKLIKIYNQTFLDFFSNKAKHTESKESIESHQNIFEDFKIHHHGRRIQKTN
jgi:predicted nucleic-acid-binding Zn-ribbon protein